MKNITILFLLVVSLSNQSSFSFDEPVHGPWRRIGGFFYEELVAWKEWTDKDSMNAFFDALAARACQDEENNERCQQKVQEYARKEVGRPLEVWPSQSKEKRVQLEEMDPSALRTLAYDASWRKACNNDARAAAKVLLEKYPVAQNLLQKGIRRLFLDINYETGESSGPEMIFGWYAQQKHPDNINQQRSLKAQLREIFADADWDSLPFVTFCNEDIKPADIEKLEDYLQDPNCLIKDLDELIAQQTEKLVL